MSKICQRLREVSLEGVTVADYFEMSGTTAHNLMPTLTCMVR